MILAGIFHDKSDPPRESLQRVTRAVIFASGEDLINDCDRLYNTNCF